MENKLLITELGFYRLKMCKPTLSLIVLLFVVLMGTVHPHEAMAGVPSWVTTPPKEKDAIVVVGVATAEALEEARQAAILDAARQVAEYMATTLQVQGETVRTEVEQRLIEETRFSSEKMPLRGGLLKEWFFSQVGDKYESFVLVRYPRKEIEEIKSSLQDNQTALITKARMDIQQGEASWKHGELSDALRAFSRALQASYGATHSMLQSDARNRITALQQSLDISIISGDEQEVKPRGRPQPLVVRITSHTGGNDIPAGGFPVLFSLDDSSDKKTAVAMTDSRGEARINPDQIGFEGTVGIYRISAEIDNEAILTRFLSPAGSNDDRDITNFMPAEIPDVTFTLKVIPVPRNTRVLILIEESNMGSVTKESIVMQTISHTLQQAGFRVVAAHEIGRSNVERIQEAIRKELLWPIRPELASQVQLVVFGSASTRRGSNNMGLAISSHADVFVKVINIENGEVVAQKNLVSTVGFGESPDVAGIRALEKAGNLVARDISAQLSLWEEANSHESK